MDTKRCRFFISHSSLDKEITSLFVDDILIKGLKIDDSEIYHSSMNGLGNLSGDDFIDKIKKTVKESEVSFLMISENYKRSEICLNEMGVSWACDCHVIPILIDPISFKTVGPLNVQKHCEKIFDDDSIYNIRATIKAKCSINPTEDGRWKSIVEKFIKEAKKIEINKPEIKTVSIDDYDKLSKTNNGLQQEINEMNDEIDEKNKYIKELELKKDRTAIIEAKKSSGIIGIEDEFNEKIGNVTSALSGFDKIIGRILLCNYYHHEIPNIDGYEDDINSAKRKRFLTCELESGSKSANKELEDALQEITFCAQMEELCNWYCEQYNEAFDASDEDFWDKFYF